MQKIRFKTVKFLPGILTLTNPTNPTTNPNSQFTFLWSKTTVISNSSFKT